MPDDTPHGPTTPPRAWAEGRRKVARPAAPWNYDCACGHVVRAVSMTAAHEGALDHEAWREEQERRRKAVVVLHCE